MSLNESQLRDWVVQPVLEHLDLPGIPAATALLIHTAKAESRLHYLRQLHGGPALGLWQMEPPTHDDIWANFLRFRDDLAGRVRTLSILGEPSADQLIGNLYYAAAMARVHYWRVPEPLPAEDDLFAQATYWKRHYNTALGKGTPEHFIAAASRDSGERLA